MQADTDKAARIIKQDTRYFERLVLGGYLYNRDMAMRLEAAGAAGVEWDSAEHKALFNGVRMYHQATGYACSPSVNVGLIENALRRCAATDFSLTEAAIPTAMQTLVRASADYCAGPQAATVFLDAGVPEWLGSQLYKTAARHISSEQSSHQVYSEVARRVTELKTRWGGRDNPLAAGRLVRPSDVARQVREPVFATLPWNAANQRLDGGLRQSDRVMILGATGAGKSVISAQIAGHMVMNQKKLGFYLFTEDEHVDYLDRIVSGLSNIPLSTLRAGIFQPTTVVSPQARQDAANYYHWLDPVTHDYRQGIFLVKYPAGEDVEAVMDTTLEHVVRMCGRRPDFMIVDWLREQMSMGSGRKDEETRDKLNKVADAVASVGDRERILTFATAQVNVTGRERIKAVSEEHLQNSKQMTRLYTVVMGISCLAEVAVSSEADMEVTATYLDEQYLNFSKMRYGRTGLLPVKRNYARQRLEARG